VPHLVSVVILSEAIVRMTTEPEVNEKMLRLIQVLRKRERERERESERERNRGRV
jgi:hypothetical protein